MSGSQCILPVVLAMITYNNNKINMERTMGTVTIVLGTEQSKQQWHSEGSAYDHTTPLPALVATTVSIFLFFLLFLYSFVTAAKLFLSSIGGSPS